MLSFVTKLGEAAMIKRERIADNVYSFQSEHYAQVTAGAVIGPEWAVAIDTLAFPEETLAIRDFIETELDVPVRYVVNTHSHADHSWGTCFFPGSIVISHVLCRKFLLEVAAPSLTELSKQNPSYQQSKIIAPQIIIETGELNLKVGKKTLTMFALPGHSRDGLGLLIEEDRILFSGDLFMPIPYLVDGDLDEMIASYNLVKELTLENIVQGHGDVVLRGEIQNEIESHLNYLSTIQKIVRRSARRKYPGDLLVTADIESCGKSRVLLGGLVEELHQKNLKALYQQLYGEPPAFSEVNEDDLYY
jgi:glyoxylase-like metal-dependent hydrolase (beta-lactamase superfamily II)